MTRSKPTALGVIDGDRATALKRGLRHVGYQHRRRRRPGDTGHIAGMGTAYVAMLTAFYVDNGPRLPLWDHLPAFSFWVLPSAIGAPVITRAIWHAKRPGRIAGREARTAPENATDPAPPPDR
jgi:hypothetical protein